MAKKSSGKNNNILKMYKPGKFNISTVIFLGILIYVIVVIFIYYNSDPIVRYEVVEGSLSNNTIYTAMALRDEECFSSSYAGYVNFLAREGQRVAVGDIVYTVDETGTLSEYLETLSLTENTLSDDELESFEEDLVNFSHVF